MAGLIADRATDEVVEALTRYRRGLGIADSPSIHFEDVDAPDVVRSRSSQVYMIHRAPWQSVALDWAVSEISIQNVARPTELEHIFL